MIKPPKNPSPKTGESPKKIPPLKGLLSPD